MCLVSYVQKEVLSFLFLTGKMTAKVLARKYMEVCILFERQRQF